VSPSPEDARSTKKPWPLLLVSVLVVGGCASQFRSLGESPQEVTGYLAAEHFIPCNAAEPDARWQVSYFGRAVHQAQYLANARLLEHPKPLLVRVSAHVSPLYSPGQLSGGYSRRISVVDMRGMQIAGTCETAGARMRPVS